VSRLLLCRRSSSDEFFSRFILGAGSGVSFRLRRGSSSDESSDELEESGESGDSFFFVAISLRNFSLVLLASSPSEEWPSSEESDSELEDVVLFSRFISGAGSGEEESRLFLRAVGASSDESRRCLDCGIFEGGRSSWYRVGLRSVEGERRRSFGGLD